MFMVNEVGFDLALAPVGRAEMPEWFHVGCKLESPDTVRALQAELSDRVYVHGDEPDFVWFRVRDPDGYPIEVYGRTPPVDALTCGNLLFGGPGSRPSPRKSPRVPCCTASRTRS